MSRLPPLLLLIAWIALVASVGPPDGDLRNYWTAAALWAEGADLSRLYDYRWFTSQAARHGHDGELVGFAVLPPPSALLLAPLLPLGPARAATAWWVVQGALGVGLAAVLGALARPAASRGARLTLGLALLLAAWPALQSHLRQGQLHLPAVLCLALALWSWRAKRDLRAGALLGLAVGLKVHAWPLVALAAVARRGRIAGAAVATLLAGGAVSVAALGWEVHAVYLREIGPAAASGWFIDPWSPAFSSLGHLARGLAAPHPQLNPGAPLDAPALTRALPAAVQAVVVGLSVAAGLRFPRLGEAGRSRVVAAAGVAALAAGPLLARYHLILVLPLVAVALGVTLGAGRRRVGAALALLFVGLMVAPAPAAWSEGWARLLDLPRLAAALGLWAALMPWGRRPVGLPALGGVLLLAGLVGARAASVPAADDGARPLAAPGQPLVAADLSVDGDALVLSGLPGAGHAAAGGGWVTLRLDPGGGPAVVTAAAGHAFAAPAEPGARGARPGPGGGRLVSRSTDGNADIWLLPAEGAPVRLTRHPAHDAWPAWDPARQRVWFLSDRGAGVRALRVWWLPWSAP